MARNSHLEAALAEQLAEARQLHMATGTPARVFRDFRYRTLDSWSRTRRVVGKAEHTTEAPLLVSSLPHSSAPASPMKRAPLRGSLLRPRRGGEPHRRAVRAVPRSCVFRTMAANQLLIWFSAMAYVLVDTLRRVGLRHTKVRGCRRRDHPAQAVEARCSGAHQRAPHSL
jgi:Transposase DDE domain group 1